MVHKVLADAIGFPSYSVLAKSSVYEECEMLLYHNIKAFLEKNTILEHIK